MLIGIMNWTVCEWSPAPRPHAGSRAVFPSLVLLRPVRRSCREDEEPRRRVLLGRAHCNQLESRLHTVIFTPRSQTELATQGLGRPVFLRDVCLNQHDASESPALPPLPGVDSDGSVVGRQRWGGAPSIPVWKKEEFAASSL